MYISLRKGFLGFAILTFLLFKSTTELMALDLTASWYSEESLIKEGTRKPGERQVMANGHVFKNSGYTCANRLYPLGTMVRVTNISTGKSVVCETTDRIGKRFAKTRIYLAPQVFKAISNSGTLKEGLLKVNVEVVK